MRAKELLDFGTRLAGFTETPADSCVVFDSGKPIRKLMASVNATTGDLMLAKQMGCDGFLLHHPLTGSARREFHKVFDRMVALIHEHGVPVWRARAAVQELRDRVRWSDHAADWDHLASAAAHIGITLVNIHLAADELGRLAMIEALKGVSPDATLGDVREALCAGVPELAHAANEIAFIPDDPARRAGPVAVLHAGGTNGGSSVAECLFDQSREGDSLEQVRTVLYIHVNGESAKALEARAESGKPGSLIITGHLASDAVGLNILMDALRKEYGLEIIPHGGLLPFAQSR